MFDDLSLISAVVAGAVLLIVIFFAYQRIRNDLKWFKEAPTYNQVVRSFVTISFVGAYAFGFILVVQRVTSDAAALKDVEGFGLVLALVGNYVKDIIDKLYQAEK